MTRNITSEAQVKKALHINNFREISKDKIMEFMSLIPNMDKDVAIAIINQFPIYADSAKNMVSQVNMIGESVIKSNDSSRKDSIEAYQKILDGLSEVLKSEDITNEERDSITETMSIIADKIAAKDTENKEFLKEIMKHSTTIINGVLILTATILGVNIKGKKLPQIKR